MEQETEKCIGCEKDFPEEQISHSSGEPMCEKCEAEFGKEIKDSGIEKLDEYLEARGLKGDFNTFCHAKFSNLTEEEICELDENCDHDYKRWNFSQFVQPVIAEPDGYLVNGKFFEIAKIHPHDLVHYKRDGKPVYFSPPMGIEAVISDEEIDTKKLSVKMYGSYMRVTNPEDRSYGECLEIGIKKGISLCKDKPSMDDNELFLYEEALKKRQAELDGFIQMYKNKLSEDDKNCIEFAEWLIEQKVNRALKIEGAWFIGTESKPYSIKQLYELFSSEMAKNGGKNG